MANKKRYIIIKCATIGPLTYIFFKNRKLKCGIPPSGAWRTLLTMDIDQEVFNLEMYILVIHSFQSMILKALSVEYKVLKKYYLFSY